VSVSTTIRHSVCLDLLHCAGGEKQEICKFSNFLIFLFLIVVRCRPLIGVALTWIGVHNCKPNFHQNTERHTVTVCGTTTVSSQSTHTDDAYHKNCHLQLLCIRSCCENSRVLFALGNLFLNSSESFLGSKWHSK
jgi:hypothetical protein